jgi:hypothetical protein
MDVLILLAAMSDKRIGNTLIPTGFLLLFMAAAGASPLRMLPSLIAFLFGRVLLWGWPSIKAALARGWARVPSIE